MKVILIFICANNFDERRKKKLQESADHALNGLIASMVIFSWQT